MASDYLFVQRYWSTFLNLRQEFQDLSPNERCDNWIERYFDWTESHRTAQNVDYIISNIEGLILCNPYFFKDRKGLDFQIGTGSRSMFVFDHERMGNCQLMKLNSHECIFNEHHKLRGNLVGDHMWPHKLGGPTNDRDDLHKNRLLLCEHCNSTKSSSMLMFDFSKKIEWLENQLHRIYIRKVE